MAAIVPYTPAAAPAVIAAWNAAVGADFPLTETLWQQNVVRHPLFQPEDCAVVLSDNTVAGFAVTRRPLPTMPASHPARDRGNILVMAVHPHFRGRGIGTTLLQGAEQRLAGLGCRSVALGGAVGHVIPGVPVAGDTLGFWHKHGYVEHEPAVDLRRSLDAWHPPPRPPGVRRGDYRFDQAQPNDVPALSTFLQATFPGTWSHLVPDALARGYTPGDITLLRDQAGQIGGFLCGYHVASGFLGGGTLWYPALKPGAWGSVGPLGISPPLRKQGLGLALVAAGVTHLYDRGVGDCVIDWTGLVDFYGRLGFTVWKRYHVLEKALSGENR